MKKNLLSLTLLFLVFILVSCDKKVENKMVKVLFETNGGTNVPSISVEVGSKISKPKTEKEGYESDGWYLDKDFNEEWIFEENTVNKDITLYIKWKEIKVEETISTKEMLQRLNKSIYQTEISKTEENLGLSNPSLVGVDKDKLENEIRYPVPSDAEFQHIINVEDYGLSISAKDNTIQMNQLIEDLKVKEGLKKVVFPKGVFKFSETINFRAINDLYIVGNETEWMMTSWLSIMNVVECENFHINFIDFDYEISPTISGEIISHDTNSKTVTIRVNDEFDLTNHRYNNGKINYGNYMEYIYDEVMEAYVPDANGMLRYNSTGDRINGIKDGVYDSVNKTLTLEFDPIQGEFKAPEIGKVVSVGFTMYEYAGFIIENSKNFYMETVNIYTTPGMSITAKLTENLYFNRANIMLRESSKRLMTATADGIHPMDCPGEIIISNSIFEASHDDAINIKTFYFKVDSIFRNNLTISMTTTEVRIPINVGDEIEFYEQGTFVSKGTRKVVEVTSYGTSYEIKLDKNISTGTVSKGDLVGNISRIPKVRIENSIIRNKRNRGILVQVRDAVISNTVFYNIAHGPLMVHAAFDIFAEAIVPQNIIIKNCKFFNNNSAKGLTGDISVFRYGGEIVENTIKNVVIENNYFYKSNFNSIYLSGTGDVAIKNNIFVDPAVKINSNQKNNSAIFINKVLNTTIEDNFTFIKEKSGLNFIVKENDNETKILNNTVRDDN